jgi:hypothetical protein
MISLGDGNSHERLELGKTEVQIKKAGKHWVGGELFFLVSPAI